MDGRSELGKPLLEKAVSHYTNTSAGVWGKFTFSWLNPLFRVAGKSSLLYSILGEIPRISGSKINIYGTKAFVTQSAWIQTGTVRDNILFVKDMNKDLYEEVLEACALTTDLQMWPHADMSVVGERGINLSGGQKQRIQLARAIYSGADVYLFDIWKIGLQDLRMKLSVIPQDPTLCQGTVRENLDPLQEHSDLQIWEVLNKCDKLAAIVRKDERLLDAPVSEDGKNLSIGQRKLICLARVLFQRRRILVLDEANASVDTETDNLIRKTIREDTSDCIVITVAHRIPTIIDYDLVMVLDQGHIAEYDSPVELLKDSSSDFSKLVKDFQNRISEAMA